ncbi:MAG: DUF502 domain-containing protein [Verrucomicrobiota bacterium]
MINNPMPPALKPPENIPWGWRYVLTTARNKIFAGILVAIPLIVTIWVLALAYAFVNGISDPFLSRVGIHIPGLGFIVSILLLVGLGFMATNVLGRRLLEGGERLLLRVPLVATIYAVVKQVIDSIRAFNNVSNFKRVVYIEYPSDGCRLIALVTGQFYDSVLGKEMTTVVIPTAPNPMTGLVVLVESSKLIESSLTIEEATKLIVSAGLVAPRRKVEL